MSQRTQAKRRGGLFAALATAALGVSGCAISGDAIDYEARYPIGVSSEAYILETPLAARLSENEAQRVGAFARRYRVIGDGALTIAYPDEAVADPLVGRIAATVHAQGVHPNRVVIGPYSVAADGERGVVLSFAASDALVAQCPDEWGETTANPTNSMSNRFGCAHRNNLAAMIEAPNDLIEPRASTPPNAARRIQVLGEYVSGGATAAEGDTEQTRTTN